MSEQTEPTTIADAEVIEAAQQLLQVEDPEEYEDAIHRMTHACLAWFGDPRYETHGEAVAEHLVRAPHGQVYFRSDKYPWCPAEFVPLKLTDPDARTVLEIYAQLHRIRDHAFADDLVEALELEDARERCEACGRPATAHDVEGTPLCTECFSELAADDE